jgi:hypothetical protein
MTIDEAIAAIRNKWAVPMNSVPELRAILEQLAPEQVWCGKRVWPYTENNVCVLPPHKAGRHKDAKDREFD